MADFGQAQFVEILSVARARTDLDAHEKRPIVIVTIRPQPDRSWVYHHLSKTATKHPYLVAVAPSLDHATANVSSITGRMVTSNFFVTTLPL